KRFSKHFARLQALFPKMMKFCRISNIRIMGNIMMIQAKLAAAHGAQLWDIRMENAAIIRKNARELMIQNHTLKAFGFREVKYYDIVREQLEEFRLLFREWVAGFDPQNTLWMNGDFSILPEFR